MHLHNLSIEWSLEILKKFNKKTKRTYRRENMGRHNSIEDIGPIKEKKVYRYKSTKMSNTLEEAQAHTWSKK